MPPSAHRSWELWPPSSNSSIAVDLGDARLAELAFHADDFDELAQNVSHARGKFWICIEHGRDGFDGAALIEQQSEELIAHHRLEVCEGETGSGFFAHPLKQAEASLIGDTLRQADIEECSDRRFARTALRDVSRKLIDPLGDEGAVDRSRHRAGDVEKHRRP